MSHWLPPNRYCQIRSIMLHSKVPTESVERIKAASDESVTCKLPAKLTGGQPPSVEHAAGEGLHDGFALRMNANLAQDTAHVEVYRPLADREYLGNLPRRLA